MKKLLSRIWRWPVPIYIGVGVVAIGFILLAYTWVKVAKLTSVALQLPYFISGGLTGLGLIMIGLTIVSLGARSKEEAERRRRFDQLDATLSALDSSREETPE